MVTTMRPNERYEAASSKLLDESSLKGMFAEEQRFDETIKAIDFDPRFNSVNWMFDCFQLAREIAYSYCWMSAYAEEISEQQGVKEFHLQYYADNCITRINSFRDKAALLAWAYYCPFNPNRKAEVLGYEEVLERLQYPPRFGLSIKHQDELVAQLVRLQGSHFQRMQIYRHRKIHRIEPKILMRPPQAPDGLSYMVPLFQEKEIKEFDDDLKEMYPDDDFRQSIKDGCYIKGVLFNRISVKDEYWHYAEVEEAARHCTHTCIDVAKRLSMILRRRAPLKQR